VGELGPREVGIASSRSPLFMVWRAPPPGWIKVKFDGSVFPAARRGGAGFVARDHDGKLTLAVTVSLWKVLVPLAEIIAAWNLFE